jgi:hypothetical protein
VIYVEFIERDRWMPIEIFRLLANQEASWAEGAVDRMVLQLGRTFRLGPRPSYLCLWDIPNIDRLDAWEEYFHSAAALQNLRSQAMHRAINIDRAGLYDTLHQGKPLTAPMYLVEYCQPATEANAEIREAFEDRAARHGQLRLLLLLRRVGHLGPEPALMSIWGAPSYRAAEPLLRAPSPSNARVVDVGIYRTLGDETL